MGNTNGNAIEEHRRAAAYSELRKNRVQGTVYRDYRPTVLPRNDLSTKKKSDIKDERKTPSPTPSKKVNLRSTFSHIFCF